MTDSTMVERLALVFAQHGDHFFDNDGPSSASWDDFSPREQLVATTAARAAIEAIEPELRACIAYFDGYCQDEADDEENCIDGAIQHARAVAFRDAVKALRSSLKGEGE